MHIETRWFHVVVASFMAMLAAVSPLRADAVDAHEDWLYVYDDAKLEISPTPDSLLRVFMA